MPLVSVIMPFFNAREYLNSSVGSILNQTISDFEFILVDDASTDGGRNMVESFRDSRIKLFVNSRNLGVGASLNKGMQFATGKWIARMDADDVCKPDRFLKQLAFLDLHPNCLVGTNYNDVKNGKSIPANPPLTHPEILLTLLFTTPFAHSSVMFSRELQQRHQLYYSDEFPFNEDHEMWIRWARHSQMANLQEVLLLRNIHDASISSIYFQQQVDARKKLGLRHAQTLKEEVGLTISSPADLYEFPGEKKETAFRQIIQFNQQAKIVSDQFLNNLLMTAWIQDAKLAVNASAFRVQAFKKFPGKKDDRFYIALIRLYYYAMRGFAAR